MTASEMNFATTLDFTGERMVPERADQATFWEHIYRYRFAAQFVRGKNVLDIACGEGYGTASLQAAGAASVIGVDISEEACEHARRKYGIRAEVGNALDIPLRDQSVDAVVSFETIEHIDNPAAFLSECVRVLKPDGILVLSTPNRDVYSEGGKHNQFHQEELNQEEFSDLLNQHFGSWRLYTQCPETVARWSIRNLAATRTNWVDTRGFWRVRKVLRSLIGRDVWSEIIETDRLKPVQTILSSENAFSSLVNPYAIRRWSARCRERSVYLIAVARQPKMNMVQPRVSIRP